MIKPTVILQKKEEYTSKKDKNFNVINSSSKSKRNELNKPLLEYLIDFTTTDSDFSDEDIRNEANLVIIAGYETAAIALSYVLLNLALHKDIQNKVCDELLEILEGDLDRTIDLDDLPKLKYMEMVINESMRLYSPGPTVTRQLTEDIKFDNWLIPKGASCVVSIFSLHRDGNVWKNPLKFDPDRFTPDSSKTRHPYAHIPFSAGSRNCLGKWYAWMFMKAVLATILSRYEFHTDLNETELQFEMAVSLKLIGGHQVRITPRYKDFSKFK
ncbi:cytochrome P450 4g15-like [Chrysoperla carnea]|uniref:cytochrome P450 4g15-like n=1 Tax=Chrysoperla carnea TaxID=189513 RepID=UPI001D05F0D8|nr:cytochrome P450 4g15-like [Chrysoperla carnea]